MRWRFQRAIWSSVLPSSHRSLGRRRFGVAVNAANERLRSPMQPEPNWLDFADAEMRVQKGTENFRARWGQVCQILGETRATVCFLITKPAHAAVREPSAAVGCVLQGTDQPRSDGRAAAASRPASIVEKEIKECERVGDPCFPCERRVNLFVTCNCPSAISIPQKFLCSSVYRSALE